MTSRLATALRDLAESAPVDELPGPQELRATGERRRRRTRAQVAFTAVVLAAVSVAVLARQDPTAPNPRPATPPTSPPRSDAQPQRLATDGHRFSAHAVASTGDTYVVVGDSSDLVDDSGPPVFWSADGTTWQAAQDPPDSVNVTDVIATGDGFLAVGVDRRGPAAWRSPDGDTWLAAPVRTTEDGTSGGLWGVTSTSLGFYAWGRDAGHGRLWRSPDGSTWTPVATVAVFDRPLSEGICAVRDVADGLKATGVETPPGSRQGHRVVWTSTDGDTWTLTEGSGRSAILCDAPSELGHQEARGDAGLVRIADPFGEADSMELVSADD